MTDPTTPAEQRLLIDDDRTDLRHRWTQVEEWFADDPTEAVQRADDLIDDVIDRVRAALADRHADLRSRRETLDDATTEQLRTALHHYELLLTQLIELPAPPGWHDGERGGRATTHGRPTFPRTEDRTTHGDTNEQPDSDMGARS